MYNVVFLLSDWSLCRAILAVAPVRSPSIFSQRIRVNVGSGSGVESGLVDGTRQREENGVEDGVAGEPLGETSGSREKNSGREEREKSDGEK